MRPEPDPTGKEPAIKDPEALRHAMVRDQIRSRNVRDEAVLAALMRVPRHRFTLDADLFEAHGDHPLSIGSEQTLSQPFIVAFMTEALGLDGTGRALEIGTGSGYQTAVLAETAGRVFTVEVREGLKRRAQRLLGELGYRNIAFRLGDGRAGWPEEAPFDAILVTAAPRTLPESLPEQLAPGGRLVIPVGGQGSQKLVRLTNGPEGLIREELMAVRFVPLV